MAHMIPASGAAWQTPRWQKELADAVTDPSELLRLLDLDHAGAAPAAAAAFRMRVPRPFIERMRRGDAADPLLRQVLPVADELAETAGWSGDPLAETGLHDEAGVLRKYEGRALVVTTGACGVHCRYCFRRHFPYAETRAPADGWRAVVERFAADPTLREAILSGGDPLSLADHKLAELVAGLEGVPHLDTLRLHTRQPVVLPSRVDDRLLDWMSRTRLKVVVVIHANHPAELDDAVAGAMAALRGIGVTLLNQSVLLAGVNDDDAVLAALSRRLFDIGVLPYYLHLLDRVAGAAHFEVPHERAVALHRAMQARLPGYLVPRLVRENPGQPCKERIG